MGTDKDQGIVLNVLIGVGGALLGGFLARAVMSDNPGNNGFFISFFIALVGACIVIAAWKGVRHVFSS